MKTLKLTVEYDGTDYFGFQRQKNHPTIQEELEKACAKLFQRKVNVVGAGRTDSGVHAEGQAAHIRVKSSLAPEKIKRGINYYLPKDIAVLEVRQMPAGFHARFSAKSKIYEYRIVNAPVRAPLELARSFQVYEPLDFTAMRKAAKLFEGRHDFRAFEASGGKPRRSIRTLKRCEIKREGRVITVTVESGGFLYKMVRGIAGTLIAVGRGRITIEDLRDLLQRPDRRLAGPTAPPQGLVLKEVNY